MTAWDEKDQQPKPGVKTTEFWLTLLSNTIGALLASNIIPTDSIWMRIAGVVAMAFSTHGYSTSRGRAKSG